MVVMLWYILYCCLRNLRNYPLLADRYKRFSILDNVVGSSGNQVFLPSFDLAY